MQRPLKSFSFSSLSASSSSPSPPPMEENVKLHNTVFYHPLFSCFITLYTLILIYLPNDSFRIFLSPVFLISVSLLLSLLRHGSTRESNTRPGNNKEVILNANLEETQESKLDFVEWDLRAPLEVIHEAYEEEEEQEENLKETERFPSLTFCHPESDSESESDSSSEFNFPVIEKGISPGKMGFKWEEEGLIEIKLDKYYHYHWDQTEFDFHAEEDGLIEIDLFP